MSIEKKSYSLVMIIQYTSSQMVLQGLIQFRGKYPNFFSDITIFYIEDIESGNISEEMFAANLDTAELVLIDVRSNRIASRILKEKLTNRSDVTVLTLLSAGMDLMKLNRLGTFHMGQFMTKFVKDKRPKKGKESSLKDIEVFHEQEEEKSIDFKKIFLIQKIIKFFGTIVPFGGFKHSKRVIKIMDWWQTGTVDNFICILELVASKYMGLQIPRKQKQKAQKKRKASFWRPESKDHPISIEKYLKKFPLKPEYPTLLVVFYGGLHFETSVSVVKKIFEKYSSTWNIIGFYTDGIFTTEYLYKFINPKTIPFDAVLSLIWFPFNGGPMGGHFMETHTILKKWNVPVFLGIGLYNQKYNDFLKRKEGLTPIQILAAVIFPEMDGLIDGIPLLSNIVEKATIGNKELSLIKPYVFEDNLDLMLKRIKARITLKNLKNNDKKLAFIIFNYPPGESGIGNAAYIDSLLSLTRLFKILSDNGYNITPPNDFDIYDPAELKNWLIKNGFVNSAKWFSLKDRVTNALNTSKNGFKLIKVPVQKYIHWYQALNENLRKRIEKAWGAPPGKVQTVGNDIYLPIAKFGNIYLAIQPSRGDVEDIEKSYHDQTLPPHHEYLCFYYYILNELEAHAIVHVGTHGTLEFLPGKEVGLKAEYCYNYSMMDYVPHFYLYQISNTSEAMIAKRRSLGTLISYQLPPFIDSGLESAFGKLEEKIHLLKEAELMNNPSLEEAKQELIEEAKNEGFSVSDVAELENEIIKCKSSLIPEGLHVYGDGYTHEDAVNYLWNIQPMIPHRPNLYELLSAEFDLPPRAKENLAAFIREEPDNPDRLKIKNIALHLISQILNGRSLQELKSEFPDLEFFSEPTLPSLMKKILTIGNSAMSNYELENLLNGLDGNFTPPKMGGDPIRTPQVLPSGFNLYQFNPQLIPTDMALRRGQQAAEQTLELYRKENNGQYPQNIAVVLWGFETAKTHGEAIGQILTYLGLKINELAAWRREPELIPISELNRPRINVTINICGFMRDLFSHVLEMLDEAIDLVINIDEPLEENYVKAQYNEIKKDLIKDGINEKEADIMARFRIFGPNASEYGSILPTMIESGAWKKPEELGTMYMQQMQYAYRRNSRAKPSLKIFKKQLESIDVITQVRDTAAYAVTDLDHYYEFMGGLNQASKVAGNKKGLVILVTDTTNVKVETTTLKTAINRGIKTRTANPKWVKAMLKHDYSGGKKVSNNINYLLGFAATTQQVEHESWNQIFDTMISNDEIQELMKKNNKFAFHDLIGSLLEAIQRKIWNASEEQEKKLKELYLELEGLIEQ
ncbi:MAG TPA: cobaltochelatase subunit CobN [Candidatus Deferrimicrobium sp.]|nr:cobaltochelatase subunit CobN [Candidatus Deferrimicrobium sp.]